MYATLVLLLLLPLQQDADEAYRQDYTKYTEITQIAEPAAQFDAFLAFMAEKPDARLESSILKGLQDNLTAVSGTGNSAKVYELADKWLDATTPDNPVPLALAWSAAVPAEDHAMVTNYGEKFYANNKVPDVAFSLAQAYQQLGNAAKLREFGEIVIKEAPIERSWSFAYAIVGQHDEAGRFSQASQMAKTIMTGLPAAPEGVSRSQWTDMRVYLQETVARNSYEAGRYTAAIQEYNGALRLKPRNDKAYYYIADCLLKTEKIAEAMDAFAKSYVLQGGYSARSRGILETIYRTNHGGNLTGLDEVIEKARRSLVN
jgi:tetratricopeptide (TPR) repeat protein